MHSSLTNYNTGVYRELGSFNLGMDIIYGS